MPTLKRYLLTVAVVCAIGVAVRIVFDIPLGLTIGALLVGWPLLGTLVTIDDDLPGGWSNPDGKTRPDWLTLPFWGFVALLNGGVAYGAHVLETQLQSGFEAIPWLQVGSMLGVGAWLSGPYLRSGQHVA